ncbi:transglycosylase domain-containing protein [Nocardiopsis alborubida]|uniref:Glycosyl transferase family 51 n=1 Tax=Nocardiopsis alborubida TaxID=146802 RepID=A0A7X6M998_9ACTN|nr:transglycosylase domain-containing protein [Nocardiopsis alborubida]NKY97126.1 glycosyl transferase family 51 [Nocardiopsis alborubida]
MSTERRRNADGGRRRADGPADGSRGGGGRRRADGPPRDEPSGGRRPDAGDGFWGDDAGPERPRRRRPPEQEARSEGRRRSEGERPRRPEGQRRRPDEDPRGRRRASGSGPRDPRDPRDRGRDRENAARSEGRRAPGRGSRAAAGGGGRGGRGGGRRRGRDEEPDDRPWFKRFLSKAWKPALAVFGLMIIGGVATFAILYATAPNVNELEAKADTDLSATQIMWAPEGDAEPEVAVTTGEVRRVEVQSEDIPQTVINGVLAAEQRTFYTDPGISISGIGRALLSGGEAGGGSTITQQMARNYYSDLEIDNQYIRKIREIFISIKLNQQMEKEKILSTYLNTIYFGRNAMGIQMAAQSYFGKDLDELTDAEGAFLGIIIQMPSNFQGEMGDWTRTYLTEERWPYVQDQLALMHEDDPDLGLPRAEAEALEIPELVPYGTEEGEEEQEYDPKFDYVRQAVVQEIEERYSEQGITAQDIATQGFVVQTSLDPALMDAARSSFDVLPNTPEDTMMGLTAVDPATGQIVAFHGGDNVVEDVNNSLVHRTQAGSSYKPYVLATALKNGISLNSTFDGDSPQEFPELQSPVINAGDRSWGPVNLIQSTAQSVNTPFVELAVRMTPAAVDQLAVQAGVAEEQTTTSAQGPLIALGTHQVSALDQAEGYSTFAAGGVHRPAHMVTELRTADGTVVPPNDADLLEEGEQVVTSDVAADVTYAMTQVVEPGGGGENAALPDGRPVAGKTGTSSDAVSAWFVGYTPQLVAAVGLSRADANQALEFDGQTAGEIFGGTTSANVWREFMTTAMEGVEPAQFPPPAYVGTEQSFVPTPSPSAEESDEPTDEPSPEESASESPPECDPAMPDSPECQGQQTEEPCEPGMGRDCPESPGTGDQEECGMFPRPGCEETEPSGDATDPEQDGGDQGGWPFRANGAGSDANRMIILGRDD